MADELKVGFIGGGNMAKAIAKGFITSNTVKPANITASATTEKTLAAWKVMLLALSRAPPRVSGVSAGNYELFMVFLWHLSMD